jgi:putative membrane protein
LRHLGVQDGGGKQPSSGSLQCGFEIEGSASMRNSTKLILAAFLALVVTFLSAPVLAQTPPQTGTMSSGSGSSGAPASQLHSADRSFVMAAANGGLEEVELGKLATSKATNPDVKSFGQKMVDDHSKANDQLRQVASSRGISLPADLDKKARADYNRLDKLSGDAFDRAYVKMMVKDHVKDVAEFDRESKRATDPDVRQFAASALPTLKDHLAMAKDLQGKVGGAASAAMSKHHRQSTSAGSGPGSQPR